MTSHRLKHPAEREPLANPPGEGCCRRRFTSFKALRRLGSRSSCSKTPLFSKTWGVGQFDAYEEILCFSSFCLTIFGCSALSFQGDTSDMSSSDTWRYRCSSCGEVSVVGCFRTGNVLRLITMFNAGDQFPGTKHYAPRLMTKMSAPNPLFSQASAAGGV